MVKGKYTVSFIDVKIKACKTYRKVLQKRNIEVY